MTETEDDMPVQPLDEAAAGESPLQRALRLKKAVLDARAKPPRGGRFQREQAARITTGKSRPWMSK